MVGKVELVPISDGNRITVKENEKVIVGRGSSLGCNDKKISRHHAELLLKDDNTLWIKPTHANPVFYRPSNGKTIQLPKDIERELKDGDQIGLLPSSFFFRISFATDVNNNNESDSDSLYAWKKEAKSPSDHWSPTNEFRRSTSNQDISVFDFDEDVVNIEPTRTPCKRISIEKKSSPITENKSSPTVEKKSTPVIESKPTPSKNVPAISLTRISIPSPSAEDRDGSESSDSTNDKSRKLPKWMSTATPSPIIKKKTTTPKSTYSRSSSYTPSSNAKRHLSFEGDSNVDMNELSNMSDIPSPATPSETKSPGKLLSRISATKKFDSDSEDEMNSITVRSPAPPLKKIRSNRRRRPPCQFGASCYRKNPIHRAEQSHPGDSDYDDSKQSDNNNNNNNDDDDNDIDKPECPFGKSCYRQNPQHKRDFKH